MIISWLIELWEKIRPPRVGTKNMKILIITKSRNSYGVETPNTLSTGLFNSSQHIVMTLENEPGITIQLVSVVDNNSIDREVTLFRPDVVIIEALWVVPEKFAVLKALHPTVKWIVRLHSEISFIAFEGVALDWITKYLRDQRIYVALNSKNMYQDFNHLFQDCQDQLLYIPNCYHLEHGYPGIKSHFTTRVHIGCFGAVRGLKNHLAQAVAAIQFADENNCSLSFHINTRKNRRLGIRKHPT